MPHPPVFTRDMAVAAGWQPKDIDKELRSGRWTGLRRGVHALTSQVPADGPARVALDVRAAPLASQHDIVGSHQTAALVHGLPLFTAYDGPVVLSLARGPAQHRPGQGAPAQLVSQIPLHHRTAVSGAVVTTAARTAIDLARRGPAPSAVVVLDGALRTGVSRGSWSGCWTTAVAGPGSAGRALGDLRRRPRRVRAGVGGAMAHARGAPAPAGPAGAGP